ncbi:MAG TPA: purine/pyrimidine permease [Methanocorpusculum sp.]|nr:purine/pyrimidine permease [Methanocorpusculum sp.]
MSESASVPEYDGPVYNTESKIPAGTLILTIVQHFFALAVYMTYPVIISGAIGGEEHMTTTLISATLIGCGIATILQACRRLGSGQVLPIIPNSSYLPASLLAATGGGLPMLYGMLIAGGIFEIIISRLTRFFRYVFPMEICGTVLFLLGIAIVPFAFPLFCGSTDSAPLDPAATAVGIITLASMIILSVIRKRIFKFYSTLMGILIGFIAAILLGVFNLETLTNITTIPVFSVPEFAFLTEGYAFNPALLAPFIIAVICLVMKTTGNIEMLNRYTKSESKKSLRRGLLAEGIGLTISGFLGGIGTGTSSSAAGLVVSTGVAARKVGFGLGILLIICGFLPVFGWFFHLIPKPILGAVLIYAVVFVMMSGITSIASRVLDSRRIFVVLLPILFGVSSAVCPYLYTSLPEWAEYFLASPLTAGSVAAVVLGLLLKIGIPHRKTLSITPSSDVSAFVMDCAGLWTLDKLQSHSLGTELSNEIKEEKEAKALTMYLSHGRETIEIDISYRNGTVKHLSRPCL